MSGRVEPLYQAIGARVRMIREVLGIDQAELGRRVRLERTSIAGIEAGRQRLLAHQVAVFATALGTTPKQLMKGIWW